MHYQSMLFYGKYFGTFIAVGSQSIQEDMYQVKHEEQNLFR